MQPTDRSYSDVYYAMLYASLAVGIPGNILSVTYSLAATSCRRYDIVGYVYLAALAINDLVYLAASLYIHVHYCFGDHSWWCTGPLSLFQSSVIIEPLHVLSFSIERLIIAIIRPLKVCH